MCERSDGSALTRREVLAAAAGAGALAALGPQAVANAASGGAIDFAGSTDARAHELERGVWVVALGVDVQLGRVHRRQPGLAVREPPGGRGVPLHRVPEAVATGAVVAGEINVRGASVSARGVASAAVNDKGVVLRVTEATAEGVQIPKSALGLLSVQLNLGDLPFGIKLTSARADRDGILIRGTATGIVIPTRR